MNTINAFTPFGWPIIIYLTLAGLACGASLCAVVFLRTEKTAREGQSYVIARTALYVALGSIVLGALLLLYDLQSPGNFYRNFSEFNPSSAIAWGTRIIAVFIMLCIYSLFLLHSMNSQEKTSPIGPLLTGLLIFFALAVGIYPALVLGQASIARPLWEPLLLAPLFLLLGLDSGFALVQLLTFKKWQEDTLEKIRKLDLAVIIGQIILFALLLSISTFSEAGMNRLLFGEFSLWFWIGVVLIGWLLPFFFSFSHSPKKNTIILTQLSLLLGAFALRAVIVFSGQGPQAFIGS